MEDFIDDESCEEDLNDYKKTIHEIFKYDPKRYKNINLDIFNNHVATTPCCVCCHDNENDVHDSFKAMLTFYNK